MKTFDKFIIEEQIRMCRSLEDYEIKYFRIAWDAALRGNKEPVDEVPCSVGLDGLLSLANELEIEGKFLDTPTGYSADKAAGQAYKECAERIRDWVEKAGAA